MLLAAVIEEESKTVSQGTIVVDAPPTDVYMLLTDYARSRKSLTDIAAVNVNRALGHAVTVEVESAPASMHGSTWM